MRELAFIVDAHDYAWAKRMKRLLLGACHQVSKRDDKTLSASQYKALQKRYRTILTQGARELPPIPPRQNGQRGKVAKSDAHNLWERLKNHETAVLRFAKHPDVAFTNNRAERDLRMAKVKQKVSGCFRTRKYAEAYCRISSYLQSHGETRVTTRWWPFRSLSPGVPLITWASSYQCPSLSTLPLFPVIVWAEQVWAGESAGLPYNFPAACACARPPSGPHRSR